MDETEEEKAAREAEEAAAAEAEKAAKEAELAAMTPEERAAKEEEEGAAAEAAAAAAAAEKKGDGATEEITTVQIGEEKPPAEEKAPDWVRDVRKRNRELEKQVKELQRSQSGQQHAQVGKKPALEDFDYDAEKFEKALSEWMAQKRKAEEEEERIAAAQKSEQASWQTKLDAYGTAKAALKVPDLDEAESLVQETLSERQQAIILKGSKNPALLVYALGKNPAKLQELAKTTDLVEFAFAVANVESQLKVTTKKAAPPAPEKKVEGSGPKSGTVDSTLERLRAEAERTGDYTKVHAHKREKKAA